MLNETWIYLSSQQIIIDWQFYACHYAITPSFPLFSYLTTIKKKKIILQLHLILDVLCLYHIYTLESIPYSS